METIAEGALHEWYDEKHRNCTETEVAFINGLPPHPCPECGSASIAKDGHDRSGIRRYRCKDCGRRFGPLAGTLLDNSKIPMSEWFEFLLHLLEEHSTFSSARDNRNAETTGYYWIFKVFEALAGYQEGIVLGMRFGWTRRIGPSIPRIASPTQTGRSSAASPGTKYAS